MAAVRAAPAREAETDIPRHPYMLLILREETDARERWLVALDVVEWSTSIGIGSPIPIQKT